MMDSLIFTVLTTKAKRDLFLTRLEGAKVDLMSKRPFSGLKKRFGPEEVEFLEKYLSSGKGKDLADKIDDLKRKVLKIPVLTVRIAFEASTDLISRVVNFLKVNDVKAVVEFKKEPGLMAGAVVEFDGRLVDFSLRKFLEDKNEI
ncbi:MAG: hypothetical protein GXP43_03155 [bacterium]|nr:hypothetical protein [bacterium]